MKKTARGAKVRGAKVRGAKVRGAKVRGAKVRGAKVPGASRKTSSPKRDPLLAPMKGGTTRRVGGVQLDVAPAGRARVKRMIYPPGFRWSKAMKPIVGTDRCMHAHAGFLARGEIHIEYADGCVVEYKAPQVVAIDPGHDGWVVGKEPVVLIEIDFESETVNLLGMPAEHRH